MCIHRYTQTHKAAPVFSVKWDHTIHTVLQVAFTYYFLDFFLPHTHNQQACTHTLLYTAQTYHHLLNYSFINRNLSFFQFPILEIMLPRKAFYVQFLHRTSLSGNHITRSAIDGSKKIHIYNFKTVLPICPIYQFTLLPTVYKVSILNPCQDWTLSLMIAHLRHGDMAPQCFDNHFKFFPICFSSSVNLLSVFPAQGFFLTLFIYRE